MNRREALRNIGMGGLAGMAVSTADASTTTSATIIVFNTVADMVSGTLPDGLTVTLVISDTVNSWPGRVKMP